MPIDLAGPATEAIRAYRGRRKVHVGLTGGSAGRVSTARVTVGSNQPTAIVSIHLTWAQDDVPMPRQWGYGALTTRDLGLPKGVVLPPDWKDLADLDQVLPQFKPYMLTPHLPKTFVLVARAEDEDWTYGSGLTKDAVLVRAEVKLSTRTKPYRSDTAILAFLRGIPD